MLYFVLFTNQTECGAEQLYLLIISQHKYKRSQENKRTVKKMCSVGIQKTKKKGQQVNFSYVTVYFLF